MWHTTSPILVQCRTDDTRLYDDREGASSCSAMTSVTGCEATLTGCEAAMVGCEVAMVGCEAAMVGCETTLIGCEAAVI